MGSVNGFDGDDTQKDEQWPPARGLPNQGRYKSAATLKWGETPFDDLDRGELLRLVQAYHAAAVNARHALVQSRGGQEKSPYWALGGVGGEAVARLEYLIGRAGDGETNPDSENIYHSFFRHADSLLFRDIAHDKDRRWGFDEGTGHLAAPFIPEEILPIPGAQPLREVQWNDLVPKSERRGT